ncbi:hypothetical protein KAURM247S_04035 [Kitasatospora aureofaciens]
MDLNIFSMPNPKPNPAKTRLFLKPIRLAGLEIAMILAQAMQSFDHFVYFFGGYADRPDYRGKD